jgi:predicted RNA binding protein YcfA (HicA-like mRNA interferase family)
MSKLPRLTGKQVIRVLKNFGFEISRIKGSHYILRHSDGRMTVVPVHSNEIIGPGLLTKILQDCKISKDEYLKFFNKK